MIQLSHDWVKSGIVSQVKWKMFWLIGPCAPWWFGGDVQGSCAGQTRDRGRLEFCCRPPRLYGTAWLAHRPCRRTLGCLQDCSRHTGSAYSGTQLPTSNKTAAHELLVLQIKRKAQTPGSECVTHILSAPGLLHPLQGSIAALQHWSIAALHSIDTRGEVFRIRKTSIICPGTCFPLIFTQVA